MDFNLDDLSNGTWHYDGQNMVYFRGDGVEDTVLLPESKAALSVKPRRRYRSNLKNRRIIKFTDRAIPAGVLVTITLRDAE